ncbi:MAG: Txe/YoeB family addiction module toxin [Actinobacteria bacterium]|nr:Txe/YoeB family addiction module toxin [Actinomycetota bacterium]
MPKNKLDQVVATPRALADLDYWRNSGNQKKLDRINALIANSLESPFVGIGAPEQLRFQDQDTYSRRIDKTHRLVYRVEGKKLVIISARFHYQK